MRKFTTGHTGEYIKDAHAGDIILYDEGEGDKQIITKVISATAFRSRNFRFYDYLRWSYLKILWKDMVGGK